MTNRAEMEVRLNEETLEYVPEHTYLRQLTSLWDNFEK
jgi:hypothetical protein